MFWVFIILNAKYNEDLLPVKLQKTEKVERKKKKEKEKAKSVTFDKESVWNIFFILNREVTILKDENRSSTFTT